MNTEISSLARLIPGHIRCPLPNPRKLKGFRGACILFSKYLAIEWFQEATYIYQLQIDDTKKGLHQTWRDQTFEDWERLLGHGEWRQHPS